MHGLTDAVADVIFDDAKFGLTKDGLNGVADIAEVSTWADLVDAGPKRASGGGEEIFDRRASRADDGGEGGISIVALIKNDEIERNFIAIL